MGHWCNHYIYTVLRPPFLRAIKKYIYIYIALKPVQITTVIMLLYIYIYIDYSYKYVVIDHHIPVY